MYAYIYTIAFSCTFTFAMHISMQHIHICLAELHRKQIAEIIHKNWKTQEMSVLSQLTNLKTLHITGATFLFVSTN